MEVCENLGRDFAYCLHRWRAEDGESDYHQCEGDGYIGNLYHCCAFQGLWQTPYPMQNLVCYK